MKIPVFGQPDSKLLETWGQIFGLYKLASSIVFSPQRIWPWLINGSLEVMQRVDF